MQGGIFRRRELYEELKQFVLKALGERVLAIILFGSYIYWGTARDIDLLVIVEGSMTPREKVLLEYEISSQARKLDLPFLDVHVLSMRDFRENLTPGTFLSGLALGYHVVLDKVDIESLILSFLEELSEDTYIFYNRHGKWNLSRMAVILLRQRLRNRANQKKILRNAH